MLFSTPLCSGLRVFENSYFLVIFAVFENTRTAAEGHRKSTVATRLFEFFGVPRKRIFHVFPFFGFSLILGVFWDASGPPLGLFRLLLGVFGGLGCPFGLLVGTFCSSGVSFGLPLAPFCAHGAPFGSVLRTWGCLGGVGASFWLFFLLLL